MLFQNMVDLKSQSGLTFQTTPMARFFYISLIQRRHRRQNEFHKTPDIDYSTQIHFTDAKWAYRGYCL